MFTKHTIMLLTYKSTQSCTRSADCVEDHFLKMNIDVQRLYDETQCFLNH